MQTDQEIMQEWKKYSPRKLSEMSAMLGKGKNWISTVARGHVTMDDKARQRVLKIMRMDKLIQQKVPDIILVKYELEQYLRKIRLGEA